MDATRFFLTFTAALLIGSGARCPGGEPAPLPIGEHARPLAEPESAAETTADAPRALALPRSIRAAAPRPQLHDAFDLEKPLADAGPLPPVRDEQLQQASTNPISPRGQRLLTLYAEAERMAGRGRSVSDLTDLIERCEQAGEKLPLTDDTELNRLTSWAYNRRGELHAAANQARQAFADFQHAVVLDAHNASALVNRGVTLAEYGQTKEALADFSHALAHDPQNALGYRNRAELLANLGEHERAVTDYNNAIALLPTDAGLYAGRGFAHAQLGRFSHAVQDYNESLRLMPGDAEILVLRASAFAEVGYFEQAVTDLDAALAIDAASASAYQSVAWLLSTCPDPRFRDPVKALEAARRAQHFGAQGDPWLLDVAAAAHASAGRFEDAVRIQQQAAMLAPQQARSELQDRLALYRQGKPFRQPPVRTAMTPSATRQARR